MRKKSARHTGAFHVALFIGSLICLLICAALFIKVLLLFQHSVFDGKQQFSLEIKEPGQMRFVVFNPDDESIHTVLVHGGSSSNPQIALGVPVDTSLTSTEDISSFSTLAQKLIFSRNAFHSSMTIIDGVRLFIFIHTADMSKAISQETSTTAAPESQDTIFSKVFTDATMYREGESVAVVNGTGVSGVGAKIARLLSHIGANVISVTTADTVSPKSFVGYSGSSSYTLTRIAHILQLPETQLSQVGISDITVTLGMDRAQEFQ